MEWTMATSRDTAAQELSMGDLNERIKFKIITEGNLLIW